MIIRLTLSICPGLFVPVASTGMSSYFSKLIPVLLPENSSLSFGGVDRRQNNGLITETDGLRRQDTQCD